jgi:hypothetical protein
MSVELLRSASMLANVPVQSSRDSVHTHVGGDNHVIIFVRCKRFGLLYIGREWEAPNALILIHGTSFCGLIVVFWRNNV